MRHMLISQAFGLFGQSLTKGSGRYLIGLVGVCKKANSYKGLERGQ